MKLSKVQSDKIQILRGIAIIAVVLIHNLPDGILQVWCRPFLNFCVGMFLFFSGLLSSVNNWNPKKRIIKVVIPYVIWTSIYVVMRNINVVNEILLKFLKGLLLGNSAAIMYYVWVYCEFTVFIPIIDKLSNSKLKYLGFIISPLEIIIMRLIPMFFGYEFNSFIRALMNISCLGWLSFFYLGYLLGNKKIEIRIRNQSLIITLIVFIVLQLIEGYWYYLNGEKNCGTQLKLSAIFTSISFILLMYRYLISDKFYNNEFLKLLGNNSFGIYFSHLAIMMVLNKIPYYLNYIVFPINGFITVIISLLCVLIGKKVLGNYAKYFAL